MAPYLSQQKERNLEMDTRLGAAKHVSTPWALRRYRTLAEWEQRAAAIRRHILVCAGL